MTTTDTSTAPVPSTNAERRHRLGVIIGSTREGRFGPTAASWIAERARIYGAFDVDLIDLADYDLPVGLPAASPKADGSAYPRPAGMSDLTARLDAADAFVIVTPEYNHSYPASLKAAIDWHYTQWVAKPVAFVSYGGPHGGRHAVLHLENVFTELQAVTVRNSVSFPSYYLGFGEDGRPFDQEASVSAKAMLDQLAWWAEALTAARARSAYPE